MPRKSIHWRAVKEYPSFPNNRRSTRFRRKKVVARKIWKEEDSSIGFRVSDTALFAPWDVPNPTDRMPGLKNYHTIHYSDAGGYAPAGPCPEMFGAFGGLGLPGMAQPESQFNPFVTENIPPKIEDVAIKTKEEWHYGICEHAWAEIDVYVTEVAPYTARIGVVDRNTYVVFAGQGGIFKEKLHAVIDLDYWKDVADDYKVNVTLNDTAQNKMFYQKEIEGWFGGVLNFLEDIWNAVAGFFTAAWEAVKGAMSGMFDWIQSMIIGMFDLTIASICSLIQNTLNQFKLWINSNFQLLNVPSLNTVHAVNQPTTTDSSDNVAKAIALYAIFAGLITLIMAFLYLSEIVEIAFKVLMAAITGGSANAAAEAFVTLLKPAIISAVIGATVTSAFVSIGNLLKPDEESLTEPFSDASDLVSGLGAIFSILFGLIELRLAQDSKDKISSAKMGVAMELIGLGILVTPFDSGGLRFLVDAVGFCFVMYGAYIFVKDYKKNPLSNIAGYTTLLETILTIVSVSGTILEIAEHAINKKWYIYDPTDPHG